MNLADLSDEQLQQLLADIENQEATRDTGSWTDPLHQGTTFGFSDELGGVGAMVGRGIHDLASGTSRDESYADTYRRERDKQRADYAAFSKRNPGTALALEAAGGLVTGGIGAGGKAVTGSLLNKALQGAKIAATEGAIYGAGTAETMADIPEEAAKGAAIGGTIGGALPLAIAGRAAYKGRPTGPDEKAFAIAEEAAGGNLRGATNQALKKSGADMAQGSTPSGMLVDTSEDAARKVRAIRTNLPSAQQMIDQRLDARYLPDMRTNQGGQLERIRGDIRRVGGEPGLSLDEIATQRAADANVGYAKAKAATPEVPSEFLTDYIDNKQFREAYSQAKVINDNARTLGETSYRLPDLDELIDPETGKILVDSLPLESIDFIKRGLDSYLGSNAEGLTKVVRSQVRQMKNQMLKRVDELAPEYGEARAKFADASSLISAGEEGQGFLKLTTPELRTTLKGLNKAERDVFKQQALEVVNDALTKPADSRDLVKTLAGNVRARENLKLILGEKRYSQLATSLINEAKQVATRQRIMGGSNTADKLADAKALEDQFTVALEMLVEGELVKPAVRSVTHAISKPWRDVTKAAQMRAADVLTETDPNKMVQNVRQAELLKKAQQARRQQSMQRGEAALPYTRRALLSPMILEDEN